MNQNTKNSIKNWAEEDRPREKLLLKGRSSLTDSELLAILIGSGSADLSAVELAKKIMNETKNNLNELAQLSLKDLMKFKGIGEAKAVTIAAALEMGRRRNTSEIIKNQKLDSSNSVYQYLKPYLLDLKHEEFWIILLKRNLEIIKSEQVSSGGTAGTVVDPKIIFKIALENQASNIILAHNHPSGNLNPSQADLLITKKLLNAGEVLDIRIADHLIFTNNGYYSFADNGNL
jgi:DNA repair protein RadC